MINIMDVQWEILGCQKGWVEMLSNLSMVEEF